MFNRMNDIKVVGRDRFYFTNFYYFTKSLGMLLEFLSPIRMGSVVYYGDSKGTVLLQRQALPNGINTSPDGR